MLLGILVSAFKQRFIDRNDNRFCMTTVSRTAAPAAGAFPQRLGL